MVSALTQTDWEWAELTLTDSCRVQSAPKTYEAGASAESQAGIIAGCDSEDEETYMDKENEHRILYLGPPSLLAYKPESKYPPFPLEKPFCCEQAKEICKLLVDMEGALSAVEVNRPIDVAPHPPFMRRRAEERLPERGLEGGQNKGNQNPSFAGTCQTISFRLSNEITAERAEPNSPQMDVRNESSVFVLQGDSGRLLEQVDFSLNTCGQLKSFQNV
ncbi:hypothetical protein DPEC_G00138080 [Dallia pectoralis]|uniref:Uncharacterized protein n=1 Tax=Dallia pectoralis TaxID=75939 RepID=A0ACC2GM83_DALPE|nr:hypothetical protein DPEC_G00138080 [Dallia pectoralis]